MRKILILLFIISYPFVVSSNEVVISTPTIMIQHHSGETEVNKDPQRVVLFDFGSFDTLDQLGLADRVIALPKLNVPAYIKMSSEHIQFNAGGMKKPDLALITKLKPDLIIITGRQRAFYPQLSAIAPTIDLSISKENYLDSMKNNIRMLGIIFNKEDAVEQQLAELDKRLTEQQIKVHTSGQKALVLLHNEGHLFPTQQSVVYQVLGVKAANIPLNTVEKSAITTAEIAASRPDIIFIIDRSEAIGKTTLDFSQWEDSILQSTSVYQQGHIYSLTADLWYLSGGGLQSFALQTQEIMDKIK